MQSGDIQVYDKPNKTLWTNKAFWIVLIVSLILGVGGYAVYFS